MKGGDTTNKVYELKELTCHQKTPYKKAIESLRPCFICEYRAAGVCSPEDKKCVPRWLVNDLLYLVDYHFTMVAEQQKKGKN